MKARLYANQMTTGGIARDYLRLVKNASSRPAKEMDESHGREAQDILESIREQDNSGYELDIDISGKDMIRQMDRDFEDMGLIPYFFSDAARAAGEGITVGSYVTIPGDDRQFMTVAISRRKGSVRIRDAAGDEYTVPWRLPRPLRECNDAEVCMSTTHQDGQPKTDSYYFSRLARERGQDLQVGDIVSVRGLDKKRYRIEDIFWRYGWVRVRSVGGSAESLGMPLKHIRPWRE